MSAYYRDDRTGDWRPLDAAPVDYNGRPGMVPRTRWCVLVCLAFGVAFWAVLLLFLNSIT